MYGLLWGGTVTEPDEPEPTIKSFVLNDPNHSAIKTFQYEEGMTWAEFIASDYNEPVISGDTAKWFFESNGNVWVEGHYYLYLYETAVWIKTTDVITYETYYTQG